MPKNASPKKAPTTKKATAAKPEPDEVVGDEQVTDEPGSEVASLIPPVDAEADEEEDLPPVLVLGEGEDQHEFPTRGRVPQWAFFKLAVYAKQKDELGQMAAVYEILKYLVTEEAFPALDEYLNTNSFDMETLMEAVNKVAMELTGRPLAGSSAS